MKQILIVVDMQKDYVDGALGTQEAQAIVPRVARKIRQHNGPIFVTYDTHFDAYLQSNEGSHLPVPHCVKGSDGWKLDAQVQQALEGKIYTPVEKFTFGSVDLPALVEAATDGEAFEIELIGLCTDICVVSNALVLKAHFPETEIWVDPGCCAGVTPESHAAALKTMAMCQIQMR